ncbi:MAG: D-2-hydroxyacid dehydrogenase [Chloroflexi bacterium]|nr:D-2-hydroxyacid dehydrogenase [Chloroflexota bacterium]
MTTLLMNFEPGTLSRAQIEHVQATAPHMKLLVTHDPTEIEATIDTIEIAAGGFPRALLAKAHNLRWLQQWGAGADWLMRHPEAVDMDFVLTNASGVHAIPISEHIIALILAFARGLHHAIRAQSRHEWSSEAEPPGIFEVTGKTMLLIGVGAIGARTARLASALGMHVLGVRRDPSVSVEGVASMSGPDRLSELLPQADFVVLTVPLTHRTSGMIGEYELNLMKSTAYIINIGRGGTIDEAALVQALNNGKIAGAGMDVFETEPLPGNSLLWDMDNVIITAHYSGRTPHYDERAFDIFLDNLKRYQAGLPLRNVVNKRLGY